MDSRYIHDFSEGDGGGAVRADVTGFRPDVTTQVKGERAKVKTLPETTEVEEYGSAQGKNETYYKQKIFAASQANESAGMCAVNPGVGEENLDGIIELDNQASASEVQNTQPDNRFDFSNISLESVQDYLQGLTPAQWKKYAVVAGVTLLGRRILFGGGRR